MNNTLSRILKVSSLAAALAVGLGAVGTVQAYPHGRGGHGHIGVWIGGPGPFWWGAPYGYAYGYGYPYAERPIIVQAPAEPVVVAPSAAQQSNTWYYCREAQMYYPYVSQCASPWQEVPATPPAPASTRSAPAPVPPR